MLHVRGSYDQELIFGSISAAGQVSGGMWQSMAKKIMADLGGGGQQWTTIGNNGQQWATMDNNRHKGKQSAVLHASLMTFLLMAFL